MTNTIDSKNTSNFFLRQSKRITRGSHILGPISKPTVFKVSWSGRTDFPREEDQKKILFLSKRGITRSPIAREVMRFVLEKTDFAGKAIVSSAGVTQAYDDCPIDKRMQQFCKTLGYNLQANSCFATPSILKGADLIVSLDHDSEEFIRVQNRAIRGKVCSLGAHMAPGCEPYISDPFDRGDDLSVDECYESIVTTIEYGCTKLCSALSSLFS